jgi:hypothetical protein
MSDRHIESERIRWLNTKARGKNRFIRLSILRNFVFWTILILGLSVLTRSHVLSELYLDLIFLPIFLLEGYLAGGWQWKDFEKKFTE